MTNLINFPNQIQNTSPLQKENIQDVLSKSKLAVTDSFENNSVGKIITDDEPTSKKTAILMVPALMLLDNIVEDNISGKNGILKKIANLGDKISHSLNLDKLFSKKSVSKLSGFLKKNRFFKYFTGDFKAVPKTPFAKGVKMSETYSNELLKNIQQAVTLPTYGAVEKSLSPKALETIKKLSSKDNLSVISPKALISTADELIKNGIDTVKPGSMLSKYSSLSASKNKLITSMSKMGTTGIGSTAAKAALKTKDVLTYGGGLLSLYFTASALINAVKAAKDAPKGEKKSTFMHVLSEQYVGLILIQPCTNLMYKICGNKYRGMTKDARQMLKNLVKNTNANEALTKEGLKIAKLQRELLINGVDKNKVMLLSKKSFAEAKAIAKTLKGAKLKFWEKPLKFAGKFLSMGLDKMKRAKSIKLPFKLPLVPSKIKIPQPTIGGFIGGAMRLGIIMMVLQPLLQKPITKLTHKIFGEPKTYLKKQKGNVENKQIEEQNIKPNPQITPNEKKETNLIKLYTR